MFLLILFALGNDRSHKKKQFDDPAVPNKSTDSGWLSEHDYKHELAELKQLEFLLDEYDSELSMDNVEYLRNKTSQSMASKLRYEEDLGKDGMAELTTMVKKLKAIHGGKCEKCGKPGTIVRQYFLISFY